MRSVDLSPRLF